MQSSASSPKLALAIPFYRGLKFLQRAVQSVQSQSNDQWLLVIGDDGGVEPGAEAYVQSLNDPRIQYSRSPEHLGMVRNWNRCLQLAREAAPSIHFVSLLHADDELMPNYVDTMLEGWKKYPEAAALFCRTTVINAEGSPQFSFPDLYKRWLSPSAQQPIVLKGQSGLRRLLAGNFIFCPTLCYRASLNDLEFPSRWRMVQDLDFTTHQLLRGEMLVGLPVLAYRYRRHAGNATELYTESLLRFEEEFALLKQLALECQSIGWIQAQRQAERATIVRLHLGYRILIDTVGLRWASALKKTRFLLGKRV